jgi:hypothetical protein
MKLKIDPRVYLPKKKYIAVYDMGNRVIIKLIH